MRTRTAGAIAYRERTSYITEGNTVRVVRRETDPFYERDLTRKAALKNRNFRQEADARADRRRASVSMELPSLLVLVAAVIVVVAILMSFLSLRSSVDMHLSAIRKMETTLEALKNENDALEQSIDTSVDLAYVYNTAVGKLGMVHAGQENVVTYEKTESEYVRQYERIPEL